MSIKQQLIFALLLFGEGCHLFAQPQAAVWYFGPKAGLTFASGKPVELKDGKLNTLEGSAGICDENGKLLFYTDGVTVWNRNHQVMDNGTGLKGHWSSTQSALVVPRPGSPQRYYIFTSDEGGYIAPPNDGVCYSEVDLCLANGLGGVLAVTKNTLLHKPATEKLAAVHHRNGTDFWLVTHEWNSNAFRAYLVTKDGVSTRPVMSRIGFRHGLEPDDFNRYSLDNSIGQMKISPDGKHLAVAIEFANKAELFDFDDQTGKVSNLVELNPQDHPNPDRDAYFRKPYGIAFSNDGSKLYVNTQSIIYQYDVSLAAAEAIQAAEQWWPPAYSSMESYTGGGLQLGTDGRIYMANLRWDANMTAFVPYLDVIAQPNEFGPGCDYKHKALKLSVEGDFYCLPGFVDSFFFPGPVINHQGNRQGDAILFSISSNKGVASIAWNFGDLASNANNSSVLTPRHTFAKAQDYQVRAEIRFEDGTSQTLVRKIIIHPGLDLALGPDTTLCPGQVLPLQVNLPGSTCHWSDGTVADNFLVSKPGIYWVEACTDGGSKRDSIRVTYFPELKVELGPDQIVCGNKPVLLKATASGSKHQWSTGSTDSVLVVTRSGQYAVNVTNRCGSESDSVYITFEPSPTLQLGRDTILCVGQVLRLDATHPLGQSYQWQNGHRAPILSVMKPGMYWVEVAGKTTCRLRDSIQVEFVECENQLIIPNVFTPNGDHYNEHFEIRGIVEGRWELQIANRYGQLLFESKGYRNEWRGEGLPPGVYYYYLQDMRSPRSYRGWVQLLK